MTFDTIFCLLILIYMIPSSNTDQIKFEVFSYGFEFIPSNPDGLLYTVGNKKNRMRCIKECSNNILCRTVTYDKSTLQCSVFSSWLSEGNISASASPVRQIAYIDQESILYVSYLQSCNPSYDPINRYMQCVNNTWICPNGYFFNGSICEQQRSINQFCQNDDWCDSSVYLICSNWSNTCRCNSSMKWVGSQCNSICPTGQIGVSFEDLTVPMTIPNGYAGFLWSNMQTCTYGGARRACNTIIGPMIFSRLLGTFDFRQAIVFSYISSLNITFIGKNTGIVLYTYTATYNGNSIWTLTASWNNVDTIIIQSSPQSTIPIMNFDDACYSL